MEFLTFWDKAVLRIVLTTEEVISQLKRCDVSLAKKHFILIIIIIIERVLLKCH